MKRVTFEEAQPFKLALEGAFFAKDVMDFDDDSLDGDFGGADNLEDDIARFERHRLDQKGGMSWEEEAAELSSDEDTEIRKAQAVAKPRSTADLHTKKKVLETRLRETGSRGGCAAESCGARERSQRSQTWSDGAQRPAPRRSRAPWPWTSLVTAAS